jgi:hypothetical protein
MSKQTVSADGGAMPAKGLQTRRAALGALACVPALAILPAAALATPSTVEAVRSVADGWIKGPVGADPIFAAIERHKATWTGYMDLSDRTDDVAAEEEGWRATQADREACDAASDAETECMDALLATVPMTAAGARAAIAYLVRFDDECMPDMSGRFLATLLKSPLLAETADRAPAVAA